MNVPLSCYRHLFSDFSCSRLHIESQQDCREKGLDEPVESLAYSLGKQSLLFLVNRECCITFAALFSVDDGGQRLSPF